MLSNRFPSREAGGCRLGRRDPVRTFAPENGGTGTRNRKKRIEARGRQGRQRLVRIESPRVKDLAAGWTDPPKRARRRETPGSSSRSGQSAQAPHPGGIIGSKHDDRDAIPSGNAEHGCTVSERAQSSVWMAVLLGAHLACAKGREARADASFAGSSRAVDAVSGDRGVKGCDAGVRVPQKRYTSPATGGSRGSSDSQTTQASRIRSHRSLLTGRAGGGSRPAGSTARAGRSKGRSVPAQRRHGAWSRGCRARG